MNNQASGIRGQGSATRSRYLLSSGAVLLLAVSAVILALLAVSCLWIPEVRSQVPAPAPSSVAPLTEMKIVARVNSSIDRALEYLAAKQRPDGGWENNHAVNGLAILAFMGRGHVPGRGRF